VLPKSVSLLLLTKKKKKNKGEKILNGQAGETKIHDGNVTWVEMGQA